MHKAKLQEEWARREHWIFKEPFEKRGPKKGRNRERLLFTAAQSSDNRNRHRCFREGNAVRISSRSAHKWMDGEVAMILSSSVVFVRCEEGSSE